MARASGTVSSASGKMVVGDDEVEAEAPRGFGFGEGAHAGVDGDDQPHAVGIGGFAARSIAGRSLRGGDAARESALRRRAFRWRS